MRYITGVSGPAIRAVAHEVGLGLLVTPAGGLRHQIDKYPAWAADNGMFTEYVSEEKWWAWLDLLPREGCLFATAPDVVGDWEKSWERSRPWLARIRERGFPAALVAQDGMTVEDLHTTAGEWDVLFIGGTTEWKESQAVLDLIKAAKAMGRYVHVGRVNSWRRLEHFAASGADSVDGTYLRASPDVLLPKLKQWMRRLDSQPMLAYPE